MSTDPRPVSDAFTKVSAEKPTDKPETKKRRSPLTIRLSDAQWDELEQASQGMSYGAYAKDCMFAQQRARKGSAVQDYELLARVLAELGQSELFSKLDTLIELAERGELSLSPDAEFELGLACACVIEMRDQLIRALGLMPKR